MASASSIALDPTYLYHKITGTTTIGTITGASSEGQVAILIIQGALTLTHTGTDTANSIKIAGVSGSAPANYVATGASALVNHFVKLVYTKLDGAYTNFQWVQVPT